MDPLCCSRHIARLLPLVSPAPENFSKAHTSWHLDLFFLHQLPQGAGSEFDGSYLKDSGMRAPPSEHSVTFQTSDSPAMFIQTWQFLLQLFSWSTLEALALTRERSCGVLSNHRAGADEGMVAAFSVALMVVLRGM